MNVAGAYSANEGRSIIEFKMCGYSEIRVARYRPIYNGKLAELEQNELKNADPQTYYDRTVALVIFKMAPLA